MIRTYFTKCINKTLRREFGTAFNVVKSRLAPIEIPNVPIHEVVWKNLEKWPDKTAVTCIETNRSYTYHQLYKNSLALTKFLRNCIKLRTEDTAAIVLPNLPEYPLILFGTLQAGLRVTTCNPSYTPNEIRRQLHDSDTKIVFTYHPLVPVVKKALENINREVMIISVNHQNQERPNGIIDLKEIISEEPGSPVVVNTEHVALLPYSSGTTGLPKGVELTQKNIVSNMFQMTSNEVRLMQETTLEHQDVIPAFLPFFHVYGLAVILLRAIAMGAKMITIPKFSSEVFIKLLREYHSDIVYGVPSTVLLATNNENITVKDLSCLRAIVSGAAPLGASDVEQFKDKTKGKIDILQAYGMTETSPVTIHQTKHLDFGLKEGGSGILIPNVEARIIPLEGPNNKSLGPNKIGEILFRGPMIMKGYFNNPEATEEVIIEDGWFKSGDVGYYDKDGHFYITDRLKELIKVKGFQVAPAELEAILREHPSVEDAAVIGVPHNILGEAPKGFVVLKQGKKIKNLEIEEFVASKVSKHKHLVGGLTILDAIPKNPSGKILRRELRKLN